MAPIKCCVGGCPATDDTHYLFRMPKNDNLRSLWMAFLVPTNPLLAGLTQEQLLIKRVCHEHFDKDQLYGYCRTRYSYPCFFSDKEMTFGKSLPEGEFIQADLLLLFKLSRPYTKLPYFNYFQNHILFWLNKKRMRIMSLMNQSVDQVIFFSC